MGKGLKPLRDHWDHQKMPPVAYDCVVHAGVTFQKRPEDGRMKSIAFIKDPDGYWIEIFSSKASRAMAES